MSDNNLPAPAKPGSRKTRGAGRNLLLAGGALGALGYGAWQAGRSRFSSKIAGTLRLAGLLAPVEVIRDRWGVPHLYARNEADLFMAQGFVQAQDRFWQMELQRRTAAGRLAEMFGEEALSADRFLRRLELYHHAQYSYRWIVEHEDCTPLDRFAAGVNAFIATRKLPLEFSLLRYQPEPWTPTDTLGWLIVMTLAQSNNFWTELARAEIVREVGAELAARLEPWPQPGHPLIVPPGADYQGANFGAILQEYSRLADLLGLLRAANGSNNWVVDGSKTTTGQPILVNDPHIAAQLPGVFYAMHLQAPGFEVNGATVPGAPGVILGRNPHVAWGVTNTMGDFQDAFIEKIDPLNPRRYEYKGQWRDFETRFEEIKIKGGKTVRQEQFRSVHGPVLSEFSVGGAVAADGGSVQGAPVALAWSLYHRPFSITGALAVNRATNWSEFRAALAKCPFPSLNFVYADTAGNIGYQYTGLIPLRSSGLGLVPKPGHTGQYDWNGFVPFEELPSLYNPESHFIATANNLMAGADYRFSLGNDYANGARAERIRQLLTAREKFSVEDMAAMLRDVVSLNGLRFARHLARLQPQDATERRALDLLKIWDGSLEAGSVPGCLYQVISGRFLRIILEPQLGPAATDHYLGVLQGGLGQLTGLYSLAGPHLLGYLERQDNSILPEGLTYDAALQQALSQGVNWLRRKLGDDMRLWEWGKLHQVNYTHLLGARPPLDVIFNRGPFPVGGDSDTIFQTAYAFKDGIFNAVGGTPAWRMVADMAQPDSSLMSVTGGQSGSPFSPHYADLIEPWLNGQLHPMLFTRSALAAHSAGVLRLEPEA